MQSFFDMDEVVQPAASGCDEAGPERYRYGGFISYAQTETLLSLAEALHRDIPDFVRPWYRLPVPETKVFLDKSNLAANPDLWGSFESALDASSYLILLASPATAVSYWVNREVEHWLRSRSPQRILILLVEGELVIDKPSGLLDRQRTAVLPPALLQALDKPLLWVDLRKAAPGVSGAVAQTQYRQALARIVATLRGLDDPDVLLALHQRQRARRAMVFVVACGLVLSLIAGLWLTQRTRWVRESELLAQAARQEVTQGNFYQAARLALQGLPEPHERFRPRVAEAEAALRWAMSQIGPKRAVIQPEGSIEVVRFHDHTSFWILSDGTDAVLWTVDGAAGTTLPHPATVLDLQVTEEREVVTAARDCRVRVWSPRGELTSEFEFAGPGRRQGCDQAVFDAKASRVLWIDEAGASVVLWTFRSGEVVELRHPESFLGRVTGGSFTASSDRVITTSWDGRARVWCSDGELACTVVHESPVDLARASRDETWLLTASRGGQTKVAPMCSCTAAGPLGERFQDALWSRPGIRASLDRASERVVLVARSEPSATLLQVDGRVLSSLRHPSGAHLTRAEFSLAGGLLATAAIDGSVAVWTQEGGLVTTFQHEDEVKFLSFGPDEQHLVTTTADGAAHVWSLVGLSPEVSLHAGRVVRLRVSPTGGQVLSASSDGRAVILRSDVEMLSGEVMAEFVHEAAIREAVFDPAGSRIATASWDRSARVWGLDGNLLQVVRHLDGVSDVSFSPDGALLLTASEDGTAQLLSLRTREVTTLDSAYGVSRVFLHPESQQILTVHGSSIRAWSLAGELIGESQCGAGGLLSVFTDQGWFAVSPLVQGEDVSVAICSLPDGLRFEVDTQDRLTSIDFSAAANRVALGWMSGRVTLWRSDGFLTTTLEHTAPVRSVRFSAQGNSVFTASEDGTVLHWTLDGHPIHSFSHSAPVCALAVSPDGTLLVVGTEVGTVRLWRLGLDHEALETLMARSSALLEW